MKLRNLTILAVMMLAIVLWWSKREAIRDASRIEPLPQDSVADKPSKNIQDETKTPTAPAQIPTSPAVTSESKEKLVQEIRTQIKVGLSALYASQKAFFAEYGRYSTDLQAIGWEPATFLDAKFGFINPFVPERREDGENGNFRDSDDFVGQGFQHSQSAAKIMMRDLERYCTRGCSADEKHFEAISASNLDDDDTLDVWLMNEKKEMIHVVDDLEEKTK